MGTGNPLLLRLERLGAGRLAGLVEGELFHPRLRLLQEAVAVLLERLATLVDVDALLQLHVAALQAPDDALELLQRLLERHVLMSRCLAAGLAISLSILGHSRV